MRKLLPRSDRISVLLHSLTFYFSLFLPNWSPTMFCGLYFPFWLIVVSFLRSPPALATSSPSTHLRGLLHSSNRLLPESVPVSTSILCHVMQVRIDFFMDKNNATGIDHDEGEQLVCEVSLTSIKDRDTAMFLYRIENLPENIILDLDDPQQSWIHISHAIRNDSTAVLEILPEASVAIVPRPSNAISLMGAHSSSSASSSSSPSTSETSIYHRHLTRAYQNMGISKVLVVRVSYLGFFPDVSADDLRGEIFGMGKAANREVNLRRQIKSCSFGKLILRPAAPIPPRDRSDDSNPIVQGVVEMNISEPVLQSRDSARVLENAVILKLTQWFSSNYLMFNTNHVMLVFPDAPEHLRLSGHNYLAYAILRGTLSVYNNRWATSISALAHEFGHNMNLNHAGQKSAVYGDTTGYLGYGVIREDFPRNCYNAQKNWFLQWYQDRSRALRAPPPPSASTGSASISSSSTGLLPWTGDLATFIDYDETNVYQPVVLQIQSDNQEKRFYLQYNRAKKFNRDTRLYKNTIVIVKEQGTLQATYGIQSWLIGAIEPPPIRVQAEPNEYQLNFTGFASEDRVLQIQVCQQVRGPVDYVRISIFLEGQVSGCIESDHEVGAPYPTVSPTVSSAPSSMPSISPQPTLAPTPAPTGSSAPTAFCEDSIDKVFEYWEDNAHSNPSLVDCVWLQLRPKSERDNLCSDSDSDARNVCPGTCKQCKDHCEDDVKEDFFVSNHIGWKNCRWLWIRPQWQGTLCIPGHAAYSLCQETCNSCPPPTTQPTAAPTNATNAPSATPTLFCEDSMRRFKATPTSNSYINCGWLTRHPDIVEKERFCDPDNENSNAHGMCPDTCGLCFDDCRDDPSQTFYVNSDWGNQTCLWLSTRANLVSRLCAEGHDAYELCTDTCNRCSPGRPPCEDSPPGDLFWVAKGTSNARQRDCIWLQRRSASEQESYCQITDITDMDSAWALCPETCGRCTDTCYDSVSASFFVNNVQGNRDCKWLLSRPYWQERLCEPGSIPWESCQESCNSCDSS
jgi:hypothetical protein